MMNAVNTKVPAAIIAAFAVFTVLAQEVPASNPLSRSRLLNRRGGQTPAPQTSKPSDPGEVTMSGETSVMQMDGAPLELVLKIYGELVNKTIIVDPAVQGTLNNTIKFKAAPGQKLTNEERIFAYETILEMNQVHLEPYGESFIRALPRKDVRKEGIPLILDSDQRLGESGRVVSMMISFKNIAIDEAQKILEGLKSNSGVLLVFERTNSILVTDTEQNINRMLEIARMVDVSTPVTENVFVRQIKNAAAADILTAIQKIVEESQKEQEQGGKKSAVNTAATQQSRPSLLQSRLLRGRPQQQQPAAPVNNESIVMNVSDADRGMIRGKVVIVPDERSNKLIFVTSKSNMDFFDKIIDQLDIETTPDTVVKVYRLKYAECEDVSDMINDLIGNAPSSKSSGKGNQNQNARQGSSGNLTRNTPATQRKSANQRTGDAKTGELSKENTTVLADKRINGLVVMTNKDLVPVIEQIIESMDIKLSQVLIETCIIEVALSDSLKTGIDWFHGLKENNGIYNSGLAGGGGTGAPRGQSSTSSGDSSSSDSGSTVATAASIAKDAVISTPSGAGINYFVHSDKLNLSAIITASKSDSRTKYLASPIVMTVDNKEATIEATSSYQFLTGWSAVSSSYAGSGLPSPNYSAKDLGITLKIKPKINPNGTVMLNVEEEYSQLGTKQSMLQPKGSSYEPTDVETSVTRKMTSDIILENRQSVVLGGLTTKNFAESEKGIPILKEIPWVGKWLFGSTEKTESSAELLIFMTPYVLDDAAAAKVEALRRKKALSDPAPWEDSGWSDSDLADPVSRKQLLRRLKDEWAKQDDERKTRLAIEQEKLKRAKEIKMMSEAERKIWLEMHKDEIDKEKQKELEKQMLDEKSQEELKKLAESIREKKLTEAGSVLNMAAEEAKKEAK